MTLIDKACWERGCACYDSRIKDETVEVTRREWVGLTDEEVIDIGTQYQWYDGDCERFDSIGFARAIEAAHGIKGEA